MNELTTMLQERLLSLVMDTTNALPDDDPAKLRWMEIGPRSENFADEILSCEVRHNDPSNPGGWRDSEVQYWPNTDLSNKRNPIQELGGINQGFTRRFTLVLQLFYSELGLDDTIAGPAAAQMMKRLHVAFLRAGQDRRGFMGLRDDFGEQVVATNIVKHTELLGSGSSTESNYRGRFWLEFNTEFDL